MKAAEERNEIGIVIVESKDEIVRKPTGNKRSNKEQGHAHVIGLEQHQF